MSGAILLRHQLRLVHAMADRNLEGMSAEDSLVQPPGGGNCANWILGHLVNVHNELARLLGVEPAWEDPQLERVGPEPITGPESAINWHALTTRSAAVEERIGAALERLTDQELREVITTPAFGDTPRGILLSTILSHQVYHAGQLATTRRLAGHPGAIRIPGTE